MGFSGPLVTVLLPGCGGMKRRVACAVAWACLACTPPAWPQSQPGPIPDQVARRHGLERVWFTQARVSPAHGWLRDIRAHVSSKESLVVFEVQYPGGVAVVTERDTDPVGDPLGPEGARKVAEELRDRFAAQGKQATVVEVPPVPAVNLYLTTSTAVIHCLDAETGRTRWVARVGSRAQPTMPPSVTDDFVAVVNGTNLYLLDNKDGRMVWQRELEGIPGAGPVIAGNQVYVPTIDGRMEAYLLDRPDRWPSYYQAFGSADVQPTVGMMSVIWPTSRGYVNFARIDNPGVRYRIKTEWTLEFPIVTVPPDKVIVSSAELLGKAVHVAFGG